MHNLLEAWYSRNSQFLITSLLLVRISWRKCELLKCNYEPLLLTRDVSDKETDWTLSKNGMHELKIHSRKTYCFFQFTSIGTIGTFRLLSFILLSPPLWKQLPSSSSTLWDARLIIKSMLTSFYSICTGIGLIWKEPMFIFLRLFVTLFHATSTKMPVYIGSSARQYLRLWGVCSLFLQSHLHEWFTKDPKGVGKFLNSDLQNIWSWNLTEKWRTFEEWRFCYILEYQRSLQDSFVALTVCRRVWMNKCCAPQPYNTVCTVRLFTCTVEVNRYDIQV